MSSPSSKRAWNILLADDDKDDCLLFSEALEELPLPTTLTVVHTGEELMHVLTIQHAGRHENSNKRFDVLFLDLNMPRKNGNVCLKEIKQSTQLNSLPVIIFSTSYDQHVVDQLYKTGAYHYICKPVHFSELKTVLLQALERVQESTSSHQKSEVVLVRSVKENRK